MLKHEYEGKFIAVEPEGESFHVLNSNEDLVTLRYDIRKLRSDSQLDLIYYTAIV